MDRDRIRNAVPWPVLFGSRLVRTGDWRHMASFLGGAGGMTRRERAALVWGMLRVGYHVECEHTQADLLAVVEAALAVPATTAGFLVEAGCYKGGSAAKLSLAASLMGRRLVAFDSFEGIPANEEDHGQNLFGGEVHFSKGDYRGTLEEVSRNIQRFGDWRSCELVKGWLEDTLPHFKEPVVAAYLDVDLASSTRTCLRFLYPRLVVGGAILSQDGHLPLVNEVFADRAFWTAEVGCAPPRTERLSDKLVRIRKTEP